MFFSLTCYCHVAILIDNLVLAQAVSAARAGKGGYFELVDHSPRGDPGRMFQVCWSTSRAGIPREGHKLNGPGPYLVRGRVENDHGAITLTAERMENLGAGDNAGPGRL